MKEPTINKIEPEVIDQFVTIVGAKNALRTREEIAPFIEEWRGRYGGNSQLVLKPGSTDEVSALLKLASKTQTAIIPQGGNTGLVGAQMPYSSGHEVIVNLSRMNSIRQIDVLNNTITVEAGCVLQTIQQKAGEYDRLFPLSLGSEGSCQIGGNLSSNAGGTNVLKYGSARDLTLGLEVVLADGQVWEGLNGLRKNNTGYDLRNLFIGAEGTLGIITAAVMKLYPRPRDICTAIAAIPSPESAVDLLHMAEDYSGGLVTGFELLPHAGLEFVLKHISSVRHPLEDNSAWYVLMELSGGSAPDSLKPVAETLLCVAIDKGLATDAVIASNQSQAEEFWQLRLAMSEVQKQEGASIKHDVSVPISKIAEFIEKAGCAVENIMAGCRPIPFGHIGDGNIHYNISQPTDMDGSRFLSREPEITQLVYDLVMELGGSISAEHGIGKIKAHLMRDIKTPTELALMRQLKSSLDPQNILNPGKLLPVED